MMTQLTKKLDHKWLGPYPIQKVISQNTYHCHDSFLELSPNDALPFLSFGFTPFLSLRTPQVVWIGSNHSQPDLLGLILSHLMLWPEIWLEDTPMASGVWSPSEAMWPSHDNHTTTCHPHYLIGRPVSQ